MSKGDKDRTTNKKAFDENYDRIFLNAKTAQLQVTDLNWDGDLETKRLKSAIMVFKAILVIQRTTTKILR